MNTLTKIDNLEEYIDTFDIEEYVSQISVRPSVWYQSRPGKDDYWGVNFYYQNLPFIDSFLILEKFIPPLEGWRDSGYTSGRKQAEELERGNSIWETAKEKENKVKEDIFKRYNRNSHVEIIKLVHQLQEVELAFFNQFFCSTNPAYKISMFLITRDGGLTLQNAVRDQLVKNISPTLLGQLFCHPLFTRYLAYRFASMIQIERSVWKKCDKIGIAKDQGWTVMAFDQSYVNKSDFFYAFKYIKIEEIPRFLLNNYPITNFFCF
jgi:hypothetical protein